MLPSIKHLLRTGRAYFPCAGLPPPKCMGWASTAKVRRAQGWKCWPGVLTEAVATEGGDPEAQTQATAADAQPDGEVAAVADGPGEVQEGGARRLHVPPQAFSTRVFAAAALSTTH